MFIKRVNGPRAVTLANGAILTLADLPPGDTRRWVASRKAAVVHAVESGLITLSNALERYDLSEEEFSLWQKGVQNHGLDGLKVTSLQKFRQP